MMPLDDTENYLSIGDRRLLTLADHLDQITTNFHMGAFCSCALHHAGNVTEFKLAGLQMPPSSQVYGPTFDGHQGFAAAQEFFGLGFDEVRALFGPNYPLEVANKPSYVAEVIRRFVRCRVPA
jgi:hypothetical protein